MHPLDRALLEKSMLQGCWENPERYRGNDLTLFQARFVETLHEVIHV